METLSFVGKGRDGVKEIVCALLSETRKNGQLT